MPQVKAETKGFRIVSRERVDGTPRGEDNPDMSWGGNTLSLEIPDGPIDPHGPGTTRWYGWLTLGRPMVKELHELTGQFLAKEALRR